MSTAWNSLADFWAMGGYGLYVWGSFGVTALVMALEVLGVQRQHRRVRQAVRQASDAAITPNDRAV